jgi:hypothetical protein
MHRVAAVAAVAREEGQVAVADARRGAPAAQEGAQM